MSLTGSEAHRRLSWRPLRACVALAVLEGGRESLRTCRFTSPHDGSPRGSSVRVGDAPRLRPSPALQAGGQRLVRPLVRPIPPRAVDVVVHVHARNGRMCLSDRRLDPAGVRNLIFAGAAVGGVGESSRGRLCSPDPPPSRDVDLAHLTFCLGRLGGLRVEIVAERIAGNTPVTTVELVAT